MSRVVHDVTLTVKKITKKNVFYLFLKMKKKSRLFSFVEILLSIEVAIFNK